MFGRVRGISPATCIYIQYSWFFDTLHPISTAVVQQKHQVDLLRLPDSQARSEQSDPFWPPRSGVDDDLEPPSKKFKPSYLEGQEE